MRLLEGNGRSLEFLRRKVNFCICDGQGARQSAGRVAGRTIDSTYFVASP